MTGDGVATSLLLTLLNGALFANATRRNGRPCRIHLPDDPEYRIALVNAHLRGTPMLLTFHASGCKPWQERAPSMLQTSWQENLTRLKDRRHESGRPVASRLEFVRRSRSGIASRQTTAYHPAIRHGLFFWFSSNLVAHKTPR